MNDFVIELSAILDNAIFKEGVDRESGYKSIFAEMCGEGIIPEDIKVTFGIKNGYPVVFGSVNLERSIKESASTRKAESIRITANKYDPMADGYEDDAPYYEEERYHQ